MAVVTICSDFGAQENQVCHYFHCFLIYLPWSTLATLCEELTHWKRLWCWEGLGAGGEGDDRGWDGWMGSLTQWTWVWVNSGSWWWTGRPGLLRFMGLQAVGHDWATELNWTELNWMGPLTKCGSLGKGMANHFSILALRTTWTVWKGKKIGHWKMNSPGW